MQGITFEEFKKEIEKAMSHVHIHIDGPEVSISGNAICLAVALVDALKHVLDDSDERQERMIRAIITQEFAEGFVDDEG